MLLAMVATTVIIFRHKVTNQIALADGRRAIANHLAVPLDLTGIYIGLASTFHKSRIWDDTPFGFQVFDHVPLQIDGHRFGKGNAQTGGVLPDRFSASP